MAKSEDRKEEMLYQIPKRGGVLRFSRSWFNDVPYISVREWVYSSVSDELIPTKKGIHAKESDFMLASDIIANGVELKKEATKQELRDAIASIQQLPQ